MDFNDSRLLDSLCYDLVLGDYPRGINRAHIQSQVNGDPPYSEQEEDVNQIVVNTNDLTSTRLCHDGRAQLANGFMQQIGFRCRTDAGQAHNRDKWNSIVTAECKRPLKRSIQYFERQRSKFGQLILHGIAPGVWETEDAWCATPIGIEDALIPSNTLLGFKNLPVYVLRRSFTGIELQHLTQKGKRDPGWQMGMVNRCLKWIDSQMTQLRATNWPEVWAPEKVQERIKQDGGYYLGDQVPTIDCFDIYGYQDDGKESGWVRRIILDSWGAPAQSGLTSAVKPRYTMGRKTGDFWNKKDNYNGFLFTSGERKVASSWQQSIAYQFADLSAVFPARYHSIRSLGWMIYAPCHIQNRMRCKFYEAVLEALTMYFKVKDMSDAQRALKLDLVNRGFIDDTLTPLTAAERWQVNQALVEMGMRDVAQTISDNSSSWTQNQSRNESSKERTKFEVQAELQQTTQLVSVALNQAYQYEVFEDREMFRRLIKPLSTDVDARMVRERILKQRVPEKYLRPECWEIEHERVMGAGNKTMEMAIAQWLMENREKYDPEPQRTILRKATLAISDNPDLATELVPEQPKPSDSAHDAQLAAAGLLMGLPQAFKEGVNHQEYAAALIGALQNMVNKVDAKNGVPTPDELSGMQNLAGITIQGQPIQGNGITSHIKLLEEDKEAGQIAGRLSDVLGKLMNKVKQFGQHLQAAMQKAAQQNGQGGDPKDAAKVQAIQTTAAVKDANMTRSNAQRTAQRQIQFEQQMEQDRQRHHQEMIESRREHQAALAKTDLEAASTIQRNRLSSTEED